MYVCTTAGRPAKQAESALRQNIVQKDYISSVGVEPTTLGLLDPRSNQLSYEDIADRWCVITE